MRDAPPAAIWRLRAALPSLQKTILQYMLLPHMIRLLAVWGGHPAAGARIVDMHVRLLCGLTTLKPNCLTWRQTNDWLMNTQTHTTHYWMRSLCIGTGEGHGEAWALLGSCCWFWWQPSRQVRQTFATPTFLAGTIMAALHRE